MSHCTSHDFTNAPVRFPSCFYFIFFLSPAACRSIGPSNHLFRSYLFRSPAAWTHLPMRAQTLCVPGADPDDTTGVGWRSGRPRKTRHGSGRRGVCDSLFYYIFNISTLFFLFRPLLLLSFVAPRKFAPNLTFSSCVF